MITIIAFVVGLVGGAVASALLEAHAKATLQKEIDRLTAVAAKSGVTIPQVKV